MGEVTFSYQYLSPEEKKQIAAEMQKALCLKHIKEAGTRRQQGNA